MNKEELAKMGFATQSIHGGYQKNTMGALASPIYQTSTFTFESADQGGRRFLGEEEGYVYSRTSNPSCTEVEVKLALLEEGEAAVATGSGMGAISSALWTLVKSGDHVVAGETIYGCTFSLLNHGITRFGVEVTFVDTKDPENVRRAMKPNTRLVFLETPANPTLDLADLEAICRIAHAQEGCRVIVDNTFCTPYLQKPLTMGADVVVHSATKYLNGHGDVIAGFVVGSQALMDEVRCFGLKDMTGASLSPFNAFLIARGMKTLDIRMERHCANAEKVARFLKGHPAVEKIYYPGFEDFPQYELAKRQMKLPGAMIAFEVAGGKEGGKKVMDNVHLCSLAVSLGDAETLIQHPASMTHATYAPEELAEAGISQGLVRLSVGLEDPEDIISDLKQVLDSLL
ncbi:MAG: methionine gamma-lyase [Bacillota bacterium]|nr:methionine gamma-lyase [Bacillota bacterium]